MSKVLKCEWRRFSLLTSFKNVTSLLTHCGHKGTKCTASITVVMCPGQKK